MNGDAGAGVLDTLGTPLLPANEMQAIVGVADGGDLETQRGFPGSIEADAGGCFELVFEQPVEPARWTHLLIEPHSKGAPPKGSIAVVEGDGDLGSERVEFLHLEGWQAFLRVCVRSTVTVMAPAGEGSTTVNPDDRRVVLRLGPALSPVRIRGRLLEADGKPVVGAMLWVPRGSGVTDEAGRFDLEGVRPPQGVRVSFHLQRDWELSDGSDVVLVKEDGELVELGTLVVRRKREVPPGKIGIAWEADAAEPTITSVFANAPAERAGLRAGDVLLEVDGHAIASVEEGMRLIPGAPGSSLRLKVRRGRDVFLVDLRRESEDGG